MVICKVYLEPNGENYILYKDVANLDADVLILVPDEQSLHELQGLLFLYNKKSEVHLLEPGTATIYVHPDIDYHYIQGECIILGRKANLIECPDNYRIKVRGVYILARNYKAAMELFRPRYST